MHEKSGLINIALIFAHLYLRHPTHPPNTVIFMLAPSLNQGRRNLTQEIVSSPEGNQVKAESGLDRLGCLQFSRWPIDYSYLFNSILFQTSFVVVVGMFRSVERIASLIICLCVILFVHLFSPQQIEKLPGRWLSFLSREFLGKQPSSSSQIASQKVIPVI